MTAWIRLGGLAAAVAACWLSSDAFAGTYQVHACKLPDGKPAPSDGWLPFGGSGDGTWSNTCTRDRATPGILSAAGRMRLPPRKNGFAFTAPAGTNIVSLLLDRAAVPDGSFAPATYWIVSQGFAAEGSPYELEACTAGSGLCSAGRGSFSNPSHPANRVVFGGLRTRQVFAYLSTWEGGQDPTPPGSRFAIYRAIVALLDESPPVVDVPTGPLLANAALTGEVSARVVARDAGGGIATIGLLVNERVVFERPIDAANTTCRPPYTAIVPCPLATRADLTVNTALLPNGTHNVRLFATDVGGNRGVSSPFQIVTRNGSVPNGLNATRFATLNAWIGRNPRRSTTTVGYGKSRVINGALTSPDGAPIAGATLDVRSKHTRTGATSKVVGQITTDVNGRFSYRPNDGPGRTFNFGYRAYSLDDEYSATDETRLNVRPRIAFRATPRSVRNGRAVTFRGRLMSGPGRANVSVVIYALTGRGLRDRIPVEAVRTNRSGRFQLRYRFRTVTRRTAFRFNARVQRQSGYPYATGASRRVVVTVTG